MPVDPLPCATHVIGERRHARLARQRFLDVRREFLFLALLPFGGFRRKFGQHIAGQQVQRLANVLVPVPAGLLQQDDLVDAGRIERAHVSAKVVRRANAARLLEGSRQAFRAGGVSTESTVTSRLLEPLEQL